MVKRCKIDTPNRDDTMTNRKKDENTNNGPQNNTQNTRKHEGGKFSDDDHLC